MLSLPYESWPLQYAVLVEGVLIGMLLSATLLIVQVSSAMVGKTVHILWPPVLSVSISLLFGMMWASLVWLAHEFFFGTERT